MNNELRVTSHESQGTNRAFTLIELVVAVAILAMVLSFAGVIFKVSIGAYRTAMANTEIMQKLRAITDQLNADFKGLRKDGEIFVVWVATPAVTADYDNYNDCDSDGYERFDRIMFFADGDFQSYGVVSSSPVRGNTARICYMLARDATGKRAGEYTDLSLTERGRKKREEERRKRILARTQHILTADSGLDDFDFSTFGDNDWYTWNNWYEYDKISLEGWKNIPKQDKENMLTVITDVEVGNPSVDDAVWGANVNPADPNSIHMLLCEGVGEFKVQGWYDNLPRWVPEVAEGDLVLPEPYVPGVLYPYPPYGRVVLGGVLFEGSPFQELLNEARFDEIPGLGRALKFTFTLYDSRGVIERGRTFTHIVYLGN